MNLFSRPMVHGKWVNDCFPLVRAFRLWQTESYSPRSRDPGTQQSIVRSWQQPRKDGERSAGAKESQEWPFILWKRVIEMKGLARRYPPHPHNAIKYMNCGSLVCDAWMGQSLKQCLVGLKETMRVAGDLQRDPQSISLASQYSKKYS